MSATARAARVRRAPRLEALEDRKLLSSVYTVENIIFGGITTRGSYVQVRNKTTQATVRDLAQSGLGSYNPTYDRHPGMAFDAAGNLYVANYLNHSISKYGPDGTSLGLFGNPADFVSTTPQTNSLVGDLAFDNAGNLYVASPQNGDGKVRELSPSGVLINTFSPALETPGVGVQSIAVASDGHTLVYTAFGKAVKTFDTATSTQGPDLTTTLPGDHAGKVLLLNDGTMLVADWQSVVRLNGSGQVIKNYTPPTEDTPEGPKPISEIITLASDPDGTTFWLAAADSGIAYHYSIDAGTNLGQAYPYANMGIESMLLGTQPLTPAATADLGVKAVNPSVTLVPGGQTTLVYTVTNAGPNTDTNVVLTAHIPDGLTYVSSGVTAKAVSRDVRVPVGTLAKGATATVRLVVSANAPGSYSVGVNVAGDVTDPTPADNSAATMVQVAAVAAPQVVTLQRFGIHWQPTRIVLTFNQAMDARSVETLGNYAILVGTPHAYKVVRIVSAHDDATTQAVTLTPAVRLNIHYSYTLIANGHSATGLKSATGVALDGSGKGAPGTDYVKKFGIESLVRPVPPPPPVPPPVLSRRVSAQVRRTR